MLHLWGNLRLRGKTPGINAVFGVSSGETYANAANPARLVWRETAKFVILLIERYELRVLGRGQENRSLRHVFEYKMFGSKSRHSMLESF